MRPCRRLASRAKGDTWTCSNIRGATSSNGTGCPCWGGGVAETPQEARAIAERLGGKVVVKAQVKVGGRGKAGGVKLADGADEAEARATDILGMDIKGHTVHKVMLAETADIQEEYYLSYLLDRANRTFLCIASVAGGMEIETVAEEQPDRVAKIAIDANKGVDEATAREIVTAAQYPAEVAEQIVDIAVKLWQAFVAEDATLVEVNPLAKVGDGRVLPAGRQDHAGRERVVPPPPTTSRWSTQSAVDPLEQAAKAKNLNYVKLDGEVGIIGNGAGLVMSTPRRGGLRRREARRRQAGQLPRHRRRRQRPGDGQRSRDRARRPRREVGLRQRLRRHHRLRRGRQRHHPGPRPAR